MRSSHVFGTLALAVASFFVTSSAHAEAGVGFAVDSPALSERGSEWFSLDSIDIRGPMLPAMGVMGDWAHHPLVLSNGDGTTRADVVRDVWTTNLGTSMVFAERVRASLLAPVQLVAQGEPLRTANVSREAPRSGAALGDLRFALDARVYGDEHSPFRVAVGAALWAPTGDKAAYNTDEYVRVQPRASIAGDYRQLAYAGSLGLGFRRAGESGNEHVGTEMTFGASGGVRVLHRQLLIGPEIFGSTGTNGRGAPVEALLGAHYTLPTGFRMGLGAGGGLSSASGSPDARVLFSFEWAPTARSQGATPASPVVGSR